MSTTAKPLVIYHDKCADGFSAAWVFYKKYGERCDFVKGRYGDTPPNVKHRDVYLVDFSYPRKVVEQMLDQDPLSITLIDHHQSAIKDLEGLEHLKTFTDLERSGAVLAWDFLFPNVPRPTMLGHIEDRDLWRFRLPGTRPLNAYIHSLDYTFENWDALMSANVLEIANMMAQGGAVERKTSKDIRELINAGTQWGDVFGYPNIPFLNCPPMWASDAGHALGRGKKFGMTYWCAEDAVYFSLRTSDPDFDVSVLAAKFVGGGHRAAAGFKISHADYKTATPFIWTSL